MRSRARSPPVVITKRGRPVAKLVPCGPAPAERGLAGSVLKEVGDPFGTDEPGMPTLLDTHAWVWWVTEDRRLSRRRAAGDRTQPGARGDLSLSLISVWEVAKKVEKAQLVLDRPVDHWLDSALARPGSIWSS